MAKVVDLPEWQQGILHNIVVGLVKHGAYVTHLEDTDKFCIYCRQHQTQAHYTRCIYLKSKGILEILEGSE